jgi:CSLREA domain-containing protein
VAGLAVALGVSAVAAGCQPGPHLQLQVTSFADLPDVLPGDGVCEATFNGGNCTLRAAVEEANATPAGTSVAIDLPSGEYGLTRGSLVVDRDGGSLRVNAASPGARIDGSTPGWPAASRTIDVVDASVVLDSTALTGSSVGIAVADGSTAVVAFGALHDNGAAGVRVGAGGHAEVWNSTLSGNHNGVDGAGTVRLTFATVTANRGGGVAGTVAWEAHGSIVADNVGADCATASAGASTGNVVGAAGCLPGSSGGDVASNLGLGALSGDLVPGHRPSPASAYVVDAIASGTPPCAGGVADGRDQFGAPRSQGAGCDRGAVESVPASTVVDSPLDAPDLVPGDGVCATATATCTLRAAIEEEGTGLASGAFGSVAIAPGVDPVLTLGPIDLPVGLALEGNGATIDAGGAVALRSGPDSEAALLGNLTVTGGGPDGFLSWSTDGVVGLGGITATGNGPCAVVQTGPRAEVRIGDSAFSDGVCVETARLRVVRSTLPGLDASGPGAVSAHLVDSVVEGDLSLRGETFFDVEEAHLLDGVTVLGDTWQLGGQLEVTGSTFHGDLEIAEAEAVVWVTDSTVVGDVAVGAWNAAPPRFEGVTVSGHFQSSVDVDVLRSTLTGGVSVVPGPFDNPRIDLRLATVTGDATHPAVSEQDGSVRVGATILANSEGPACTSPVGTTAPSLASDATCGLGAGHLESVDPLLGPLADNGGPTWTRLPAVGSPAVDAIPLGTPTWCATSGPRYSTDQRGVARPQGPACDIGAVER